MSDTEEKIKNKKNGSKSKEKVKIFTKKKKQNQPELAIIKKLQSKYDTIDPKSISKFGDFPLSAKTLKGLRECGYHKPTEIQKETIGLALQGKDILGAAQTGSGKTLAFLIPVLEKLFVKQWTKLDGVGALVITPTRELAYQIFETLRKMGEHHDFSAGLIIGGKDLKFERNRMDQCNIIICTPGRLLQHMDENPLFDCVNMQVLVLDEADRCLDMGFEQTMNAIIANLPPKRQTLLFSATQTKSVKDLARLSLKDPSYVSVHEYSEFSTPKELSQSYVICNLHDKIAILWSFIKNHPKKKIMIFFSSCKQVKYVYEIFCKLRPGISLMALYGTLHQLRRMEIYENFCQKQSAVLFATDLASRGLDFPEVHWVVQADCPEDSATYIHRVGRTARYHRGGESLLMLLPSEIKMVEKLEERKIPIEKIEINPVKLNNPVRKMEAFLAKDPSLKEAAQRAFVSYAKAVFLMKDKEVFNVQSLDTDSFSKSLGLAFPPRIRFLQRMNAKMEQKNMNKEINISSGSKKYFSIESDEEYQEDKVQGKNESEDSGVSEEDISQTKSKSNFKVDSSDESDNDDILKVKRKDHDIELPTEKEMADLDLGRNKGKKPVTKAAAAKKILKKKIVANKKIVFNEEGEAVKGNKEKKSELAIEYEHEDEGGIDLEKAKIVLREEDKFDKQLFKDKVKAKHKEEKRKLKEKKRKDKEEAEEEKDDFGESDSENDPDLSWLPDPDKFYGEKTEEEIENLRNDFEGQHMKKERVDDEECEEVDTVGRKEKKGKKRKPKEKIDNLETVLKKKKKHKIDQISSSLDVNEAEELALMLLKNK
ncbi:probable ATP-dependent RNA helicase DDX10 [Leptinotarsa decemlineata]|uniref:probable ATP-dependent RNA helicase DDX10 n=1 Tax=Leptinotarsa decemlineata TaxID=7539 RepID=UPI003D304E26